MTRALLVVIALANIAHADQKTKWDLLGTRASLGTIPFHNQLYSTATISVAIDRPLAGKWRVLGEYDFVWLGLQDSELNLMDGAAGLPHHGHRMHAGLRRRVVDKAWGEGVVAVWLDGEAGGGAMIVERDDDVIATPHAFLGARFGLSLANLYDDTPSRWDYEIVVRALGMPDGLGVLFGIGMAWGESD